MVGQTPLGEFAAQDILGATKEALAQVRQLSRELEELKRKGQDITKVSQDLEKAKVLADRTSSQLAHTVQNLPANYQRMVLGQVRSTATAANNIDQQNQLSSILSGQGTVAPSIASQNLARLIDGIKQSAVRQVKQEMKSEWVTQYQQLNQVKGEIGSMASNPTGWAKNSAIALAGLSMVRSRFNAVTNAFDPSGTIEHLVQKGIYSNRDEFFAAYKAFGKSPHDVFMAYMGDDTRKKYMSGFVTETEKTLQSIPNGIRALMAAKKAAGSAGAIEGPGLAERMATLIKANPMTVGTAVGAAIVGGAAWQMNAANTNMESAFRMWERSSEAKNSIGQRFLNGNRPYWATRMLRDINKYDGTVEQVAGMHQGGFQVPFVESRIPGDTWVSDWQAPWLTASRTHLNESRQELAYSRLQDKLKRIQHANDANTTASALAEYNLNQVWYEKAWNATGGWLLGTHDINQQQAVTDAKAKSDKAVKENVELHMKTINEDPVRRTNNYYNLQHLRSVEEHTWEKSLQWTTI